MSRTTRALAIFACMTIVGCSNLAPDPVNLPSDIMLNIYSTPDTAPLVETLAHDYVMLTDAPVTLDTQVGSQRALLNRLHAGEIPYFVSQHLPTDTDLWAAPLAQDALILVTHPTNPVSNLSADDARRLYQGVMTDWGDVGGTAQEAVTLLSYDSGTDVRAEFERLVMGRRVITSNALAIPSAEAALQRVTATQGAIAYLPYSQLTNTARVLAIDGVLPNAQTIAANAYPLRMTVFIIGLHAPQDDAYRLFIEWTQSAAGQERLYPFAPLPR